MPEGFRVESGPLKMEGSVFGIGRVSGDFSDLSLRTGLKGVRSAVSQAGGFH